MEETGDPLLGLVFPIGILLILLFYFKRNDIEWRFKTRVLAGFVAVVFHSFIIIVFYSLETLNSFVSITVYSLYAIATIAISYILVRKDEMRYRATESTFNRTGAFDNYGRIIFDFQYFFQAESQDIIANIMSAIHSNLRLHADFAEQDRLVLTDSDENLPQAEKRTFSRTARKGTIRGGRLIQLFYTSTNGDMNGIKWWFLLRGRIDGWNLLSFLLFSPFTFLFWIIPRITGKRNISNNLRVIYPAFYEELDILSAVLSANKLTMNTLIGVLDENGVDTSDLKAQQAQVMNIQISGGKAVFGAVVQGQTNKVAPNVGASR